MKFNTKFGSKHAEEETESSVNPKFTETALGMYPYYDAETKGTRYVVVRIPYDPETGLAGKVETVCKDIREDCIDKFKVQVDELGFFSGERPKYE